MFNKKGISTIVATVLIVLITVAAVTILWTAISPLINQNLDESTACFSVQQAVSVDNDLRFTNWEPVGGCSVNPTITTKKECVAPAIYTDANTDRTKISVRVMRGAESSALTGLNVVIDHAGATLYTEVAGSTALPTENGAKVYSYITAPAPGAGVLSGTITSSVSPTITIDGEGKNCSVTSAVVEVKAKA